MGFSMAKAKRSHSVTTLKKGGPVVHPCHFCGASEAPYGFRHPGHPKDIPMGKRGTLWACAEHESDARARWAGT